MKRFFKGAYNIKPPLPKYSSTWDPSPVIKFLESQFPLETLSLQQLTYKLIMLMALTSAHRLQTFALVNLENIITKESLVEIRIPDRIKTSGKDRLQPTLAFPFFKEKLQLCVASTICYYLGMTKSLRPPTVNRLFITIKKPYKAASTQTMSRWLKNVLKMSGIDVSIFTGYSTRHATTSAAARLGLNIESIRQTAGWTEKSRVFNTFYNKPLCNDSTSFAKTILSLCDK